VISSDCGSERVVVHCADRRRRRRRAPERVTCADAVSAPATRRHAIGGMSALPTPARHACSVRAALALGRNVQDRAQGVEIGAQRCATDSDFVRNQVHHDLVAQCGRKAPGATSLPCMRDGVRVVRINHRGILQHNANHWLIWREEDEVSLCALQVLHG